MKRVRAHVQVEGLVQGVFFRDSTRRRACELGLTGWVRNLPDGRGEALFAGEEPAVEVAVAFVREGPPHSQVRHVEVGYGVYTGEFPDFRVTY
ncbi:MAG: acylphosphatase [Deltaproteobacteria bacterium]|nr:acylphosphatase [Deltaproteobacteria bacterium]